MATAASAAESLAALSLQAPPSAAAAEGALPPDVLRRIFALALDLSCTTIDEETGQPEKVQGLPVGDIAARASASTDCLTIPLGGAAPLAVWRSICLVCRSWAAALRSIPLTLELGPVKNLAAPDLLRWLCSVNVARLEFSQRQRPGPILGSPTFAAARGQDLIVVAAVAHAASWRPAAYPSLPVLVLDCGRSSVGAGWGDEAFTSEAVAGMEGLVHLQLNRFVQASALGSLPRGLQHLTLNLCEGDSVADCKELPKGLRLETLNITAAGVAVHWADLCRTQRCRVTASKMLFIQMPAPPSVPADPAAAEQATCRRLAAGLEASGCRSLQLACPAQAQVGWPNPKLAGAKGHGKPKRGQQAQQPPFEGCLMHLTAMGQLLQKSGLLKTMQVTFGMLPEAAGHSILSAQRLEGGRRVLYFQQPLSDAQASEVASAGAPVVSISFAEQGDAASAAVLGSAAFAAASGGALKEAMHVVLQPGLSLAPYTALHKLFALIPGPLSRSALPPHVLDLKLACLPSFPPAQRRLNAAEVLAGQVDLEGLRLEGWAHMDLSGLPSSVHTLTVLLPELPPGAVLGAPGGPLRLPPPGRPPLNMIGVRLKAGGRQGAGTQTVPGVGTLTTFAVGMDGSTGAPAVDLTELVQRARMVVVEGQSIEIALSCGMKEFGPLLAASPLQELQILGSQATIRFGGAAGGGGGGVMMGAGFLQMALMTSQGGSQWDILAADNGSFHIRRRGGA